MGELSLTLSCIPESVHFTLSLSLCCKSSLLPFSPFVFLYLFFLTCFFFFFLHFHLFLFFFHNLSSNKTVTNSIGNTPHSDAQLSRVSVMNSLIKSGSVSALLLSRYYTDREQRLLLRLTQPPASPCLSLRCTLPSYGSARWFKIIICNIFIDFLFFQCSHWLSKNICS